MHLSSFIPAAASSFLSSLSSVLLMASSAWLIATAALLPPLAELSVAITFVRACGIFRAVFRYLDRWLSHQATFRLLTSLRLAVYRLAVHHLPIKDTPISQGAFLNDLTVGVDVLRDFYLRAVAPPLLALFLAVLASLCLYTVSSYAAWIPFFLFISSLLIPCLTLRCYGFDEQMTAADTNYRDTLIDASTGLSDLRTGRTKACPAAGAESFFTRLESASLQRNDLEQKKRRIERHSDTLLHIVHSALFVSLFYILVEAGTLNGIWLAVYILAAETLFQEFLALPEAVRAFYRTIRVTERLLGTSSPGSPLAESAGDRAAKMPLQEQIHFSAASSNTDSSPILASSQLTFAYLKTAPIFSDLSFSIQAGEHVALIGESGTGKTSLFHLLLRLYEPDSGTLQLAGKDYSSYTAEDIRAHFAASTQASYLFSESIRANFERFHPGLSDDAILTSLQKAFFTDTLDALPQSLDTPIGEDGSLLSGGQRQRLLLALALAAKNRPILLLDEPTAGLDRQTTNRVLTFIQQESQSRTLLLISHDDSVIAHVSRTIRLHFTK
ncbi:thiol reductant ABC exporter subunit CydC [Selenomonas sp. TAMA-11512]|uniref:thiol reductant ABC exporter subunit CydC n=1 Tax=Selenomonas sp. TAMA-11512 TaxID=3095337 RepID=UPI0030D5B645